MSVKHPLSYEPQTLPRETARHYIPASQEDVQAMLDAVQVGSLNDLFAHIDKAVQFAEPPALPEELGYEALQTEMERLAGRNKTARSFLGDGLPDFSVHPVVPHVCNIRNLTTAYTPYQPERSQGTLITHWIYQCLLARLTGFEAINSSLYERSTALFEAACCALRMVRKSDTVLISDGIYPGDREVLDTLAEEADVRLEYFPVSASDGLIDADALKEKMDALGDRLAAVAFPQVNSLGLLEDVDALTDLIHGAGKLAIGIIDPLLLATGGLKAPVDFGKEGADIIVGEAQHLAIGPNFGGPGLGLFGVRHSEKAKNNVRSTPGRFVGKARDESGRECCVMVMSTREQHIRKEKATSNICSNQAFLATIAGAACLARGDEGLAEMVHKARANALAAAGRLTALKPIALAFPETAFFNEIVLSIPGNVSELIEAARQEGLHIGVDVSDRAFGGKYGLLKVSFNDHQSDRDLEQLFNFFNNRFGKEGMGESGQVPGTRQALLRQGRAGLPAGVPEEKVRAYYQQLGELNVSPDNGCYPLGSCTMKYNPFINDWAANLPGFTDIHPQAPEADAQGSLEVLFEIQEWFKKITGLPGVTTQPVAGAQGELVGLKLFQAYHRSRGEAHRDVVLIPRSAHGTNFATAAMSGFTPRKVDGQQRGIVLLEAGANGKIQLPELEEKIAEYGDRLAGVMITNPNTSGIFETDFKAVADKVHAAGGLVYMDGANMNAIAGWVDLGALGVDAVHNNLHKTWTIPHGGGGPGDAIVAVSEKLVDFLPGRLIEKDGEQYRSVKPSQSIGSFHRHWGNFAHKVRALTYLKRLGKEGVPRMAAMAVLASRYLYQSLREVYPSLPAAAGDEPRMHEFILTLTEDDFKRIEEAGVPRNSAIPRLGKLFLDFGFHAPTVAFPEVFGIMIEPTESYTKAELDRFGQAVERIIGLVRKHPEVLRDVPHFTPVDRVDEVAANRSLILFEDLNELPALNPNRISPADLNQMSFDEIEERILEKSGALA